MSEGYMCRNRDGCNRNDCGEGLAFRCKADIPQIEPIGQRQIYCSFCGKNDMEVTKLVQAPGNVAICNECCVRCADIMGIKPPQLTDYQKTLAMITAQLLTNKSRTFNSAFSLAKEVLDEACKE